MSEKLVFALAGEINLLTDQLAEAKNQGDISAITRLASENLQILISLEKGKVEIKPEDPVRFDGLVWFRTDVKLRRMLEKKLDVDFIVKPHEKDRWFEIAVQINEGQYARFLCHDRRLTSATTYIFILWLIGSAVVLFAISITFMRNQIRPIMRLAVAAEKFGKGQDVPDFKPVGATEIRQASSAFLEMRDRLKRQMEQRTAMLAGVSHDLRTPLTRMRLQMAMMKGGADIDNLRQDIDEMEKMLDGYLAFARGDSSEEREMTDIGGMVKRVIANARRQGCDVQENPGEEKIMLRVRPMAMERALINIVTNACKFAPHTWVSAYTQNGNIEISVDDDGPGIPQELRENVFRPFYRVEKSRNRKTGGVGLGLSIAQDIIHGHGGEIFLEDSNRGGLRVVIRLPQ